jgi:histone H3/H4
LHSHRYYHSISTPEDIARHETITSPASVVRVVVTAMVITYSDAILRGFVAQMCRDMGWHASHASSLEVLTQITEQYMRQLAKHCVQYANHCGRQAPTFDDIGLALNHFSIDLNELKDYINSVDSQPLEVAVPKYPIRNVSNRVLTHTDPEEDRPEW